MIIGQRGPSAVGVDKGAVLPQRHTFAQQAHRDEHVGGHSFVTDGVHAAKGSQRDRVRVRIDDIASPGTQRHQLGRHRHLDPLQRP